MEQGLSYQEAKTNQEKYGENTILGKTSFSPIKLLLEQFPNVINGLLFVAAIFSFVTQSYLDGIFILAILLANGLFSFFQEYRAQKALEKLKEYTTTVARVIRNGHLEEIAVEKITV